MDIERSLISKLISTGRLEEAVSRIDLAHFADESCREMYDYLLTYWRRYNDPPTKEVIKADRPQWEFLYPEEPLEYLLDKFVGVVNRRYTQDFAVQIAERADDLDSGETIVLEVFELVRQLAMQVPTSEVARFKDMGSRIVEYEQTKQEGRKLGVPFGFRSLDDWTGGIQPHEFATVAGFSGLGKSTLLMVMAYNMWMRGFNPLFISLEMERRVIMRRWDAMATGIDYWKLKHLELEEVSLADWRVAADQITHKPCDITVIDSLRGCTADHIFSEMIRHKPDVVFIDYLSLMRSARAARGSKLWQTLGEITQDLKQNARTLKIPIIAAAQTNRSASKEGAELDNIAYSISAIQDPDIVIGLHADEEMHKAKRMEIRLNKNRDGKLGRFYAVWDHDKQHFREEIMGDRFKRVSGE